MVTSHVRAVRSSPLATLLLAVTFGNVAAQQEYDIAIVGGRLIDPANAIDGIRNIAIVGDRIALVTEATIRARHVIYAKGLVVAP